MRKLLLISLGIALAVKINFAAAQNCAMPPSCAGLGYTMTAADCKGVAQLKCPFNQNAMFCVNCETLGYIKTVADCKAEKRVMKPCPYDKTKVVCDNCYSDGGTDRSKFCIIDFVDGVNDIYNGIYAKTNDGLGCLPCHYVQSCANGLIFDPETGACIWPE